VRIRAQRSSSRAGARRLGFAIRHVTSSLGVAGGRELLTAGHTGQLRRQSTIGFLAPTYDSDGPPGGGVAGRLSSFCPVANGVPTAAPFDQACRRPNWPAFGKFRFISLILSRILPRAAHAMRPENAAQKNAPSQRRFTAFIFLHGELLDL
jgi:hypothetical protein